MKSIFLRLAHPARVVVFALTALGAFQASAVEMEGPNVLIQRIADRVIETVKTDPSLSAGNVAGLQRVVDMQIMQHVNFQRMTAATVGRSWRTATPAQRTALQTEFKTLLIRTYAGAVRQMKDRRVAVKPLRVLPDDARVIVRSEVVGGGQPIQLDYRLEKTPNGWLIYDINVLGLWLVETYRTQFASVSGPDGDVEMLLNALKALNAANEATAG